MLPLRQARSLQTRLLAPERASQARWPWQQAKECAVAHQHCAGRIGGLGESIHLLRFKKLSMGSFELLGYDLNVLQRGKLIGLRARVRR